MISTDQQKIQELLTRGVSEVIVHEELEKKLMSGKKLRIKFGIDPTGAELHIGHAVPLRKLRQFQDMGHQIILLIGDYTAMIGDPTGRSQTRPILALEQIKTNMQTYVEQASLVLNMSNVEIRHNSEWYGAENFTHLLMDLSSKITVARVLERDDFKKRMSEGSDIQMQEILYPLLQGYDSVALKADVELGGSDQKFNLLMGRKLQKRYDQPEQDVITVPLLEGTDGEKKMSKSYGNYIALRDSPEEMYGKVLSIPDALIFKYFELATDATLLQIEDYKKQLAAGANPRDIKMKLALAITSLYHGENGARVGQEYFQSTIQNKERPDEIPELKPTAYDPVTVLVEAGFCKSKSEAKREIDGGGVKLNDKKVVGYDAPIKSGDIIQKGKRFFVKII
ncbi:MAG: tyrosine--tRNA ligase [Candidatus Magasanikbacteria bacterium RIFCSPHIGHO2_01_FULL_41_23]|uniref:Tyrosine--tRNA ligase n=1 Tax=Candidatus Magasanikbacteria bacterium RIFCSPLOWO2_01_FULL_40_15 TaxID=1798686 RepID=A0A1F6N4R1_9BACT|nr:MAG: tyrosine--tRNA ligase [Candidatus Magasanikbacteria bacterium RIFCSPHIGHO2_01_FULL_41_23]OGH66777.1 MAG: tyrosine--tRNA ligase [Candidatus Magasanikbacteria bacterium RIFCSPHIGHO2_02_FULL_41_35]OGH74575.1 MAG: tyrosine--tRNA ligase [Candidatus Magasanikbacteria bacterium RIFCSPHIGHO2_12_FULL_41_16]OGH78864.1 MAG: tyrosine--tRNA ligase [Candidatus Magasanikbacteria bacterium RIFCSPLOWO2_01_FULL_40_15]